MNDYFEACSYALEDSEFLEENVGLSRPLMRERAKEPNDLERLFVERVNARDLEGLVALYESNATLANDEGEVVIGQEHIRKFFADFLARGPQLSASVQAPALRSGDVALTSSRLDNGDVTAEVARRQPDGSWLWAIDQFAIGKQQ